MKKKTSKKPAQAIGNATNGKPAKKKSPKGGVVTNPDGAQFVEEKLSTAEFETKAMKLASLLEDKKLLRSEELELRRDFKEKRLAIDEQLSQLGYEVGHKIKKVSRQQDLPFDPTAQKPEPEVTVKV